MKHASLKIKLGFVVQALCVAGILAPSMGYAAHSVTSFSTNIDSGDKDFIAQCLAKISRVIEKTDNQLRDFFNEGNSEKYRVHIDRFDNLLVEIERDLIQPLHHKKQSHESFKLAHDILVELQTILQRLHEVLKQHESSNHIMLGTALDRLAQDFLHGNFRNNIECKIDTLTIIVETIACNETNSLKQVMIRLYEDNPLKGKDKWALLRCLRHRLGCR